MFLIGPAFAVLMVAGLVSTNWGAPIFMVAAFTLMTVFGISLCLFLSAFVRSLIRDDFFSRQ